MPSAHQKLCEVQREIALQNAEWRENRERLRALPSELRIGIPEPLLACIDHAVFGRLSSILVSAGVRA